MKNALKISVIWISLLSAATFAAGPAETSETSGVILGRAIEQSSQGDISDITLLTSLEKILRSSSQSIENRLEAAYLFTFAGTGLKDDVRAEAVAFALESPASERVLSPEAVTRLYRLRGDYFYENGKFADALKAFAEVRRRAKPGESLSDYAMLKEGWSYINQERATEALELWMAEAELRVKKKQTLPGSLLHGLGQAFTESPHRSEPIAAKLAALLVVDDADQRASLIKGLVDGLNYLKSSVEVDRWWKSLANVSWRPEIAAHIEEFSTVLGKRACDLLPLLTQARNTSALGAGNMRLLENCTVAYFKKVPGTESAREPLRTILARFELVGEQRRLRYDFLRFERDDLATCDEGLAWLGDEENTGTFTLPLKEIVSVCERVVQKYPGRIPAIAKSLAAMARPGNVAFRSPKDPALYAVNSLLKVGAMARSLAVECLARPAVFSESALFPELVAEALTASHDDETAEQMRVAFGARPTSGEGSAIWDSLSVAQFRKLADAGKLDAARDFLSQHCPLKAQKADCLSLWSYLAFKEAADPVRSDRAKSIVAEVLNSKLAKGGELSKWLDLGFKLGLSGAAWQSLKQSDNRLAVSDYSKVALFEALSTGDIFPTESELASLANAEVKDVAKFAVGLRNRPPTKLNELKIAKTSPLAPDLKTIQAVELHSRTALKSKREPVEELSAWVDFLNANSKSLARRRWVSKVMYAHGIAAVENFCSQAGTRLKKIPASTQVSAEEWGNLVHLLGERLGDCRSWVERSRQEIKPAAGKTKPGEL